MTFRIVSHCAAPQLWPVLTDCAMEIEELCLLREPQISRAEKREWGRDERRRPAPESSPDSHWKSAPRLSRRYTDADHTHANLLTPP